MAILVIDVGTSGVRASSIDGEGQLRCHRYRELLPTSPTAGLLEFDALVLAQVARTMAHDVTAAAGEADVVAITNQRGTTVCWERATGRPVGPALGWQDHRAVEEADQLAEAGYLVTPGSLAPLAAWLVKRSGLPVADLCVGTLDTWLAWQFTEGRAFVTDPTNLSGAMLWSAPEADLHEAMLDVLGLPRTMFAEVVDTAAIVGAATALPGSPPIASLAGDQMASLVGHGATRPGQTKVTFGTGAMLDLALDAGLPASAVTASGCVPMVARRVAGEISWMLEGVMVAAGANVEWLRDGLGLVGSFAEVESLASSCADAGGVTFVPAILGLGTPTWDLDATGMFHGLTRTTTKPQVVRAVLEGVAHATADLVEAARSDSGLAIDRLSIDGGMSRNRTFVQAVADATALPIDVAPADTTTLGAAFLAGLAIGTWSDRAELDGTWAPERTVEPSGTLDRSTWADARHRARRLDRT